MLPEFENPFADYGNIVRGERFIGRADGLRVIENRVIRPREPGNLAVIGDYRIGKSSLVYKAVMERKKHLLEKKCLPVWINLATYDQASIFFRSLVTLCYEEMEELGWLTEAIKMAAKRVLEDELSWSEGYGYIQRFFERVRQADARILFILDEFDHARCLFKGDISAFQGLRELSYRPEWRVTFITTSRRTLRDIELQSSAKTKTTGTSGISCWLKSETLWLTTEITAYTSMRNRLRRDIAKRFWPFCLIQPKAVIPLTDRSG